ncbi:TPA: hypothetical protein NBJ31_001099 [Corynebacterium striatum]|nr:hypothetical protein [Corynebacterium striatum]
MDTLETKLAPLQEQYSEQLTKRREEAVETFRRFMEVHGDDEKLKQHKTWQAPYVDAFAREVAPKLSVDEVELVLGQSLVEYHGSDWLVVGENDGEPVFGIFDPARRSAVLPAPTPAKSWKVILSSSSASTGSRSGTLSRMLRNILRASP